MGLDMNKTLIRYFNNPLLLFAYFARASKGFRFLDDKTYLSLMYFSIYKKKINLKNPKLFSEKLQWLKLYDRSPLYTKMVDKYEAKKYVANIIGEEYIIPTLGVWDKFDDIDFNKLPSHYVLKCTHDSGGLVICRNHDINIESAKQKIENSLHTDYYWLFREWPYKNVKPRIIAEKFLDNGINGLIDYKFYCFNGEPKFLYVSKGLEDHRTARISFLNLDWTFANYHRDDYAEFETLPPKPINYETMLNIARKLSSGIKFLRVDLYEVDNHVYFSELTFSPNSGFMTFRDEETDAEIGSLLDISGR